MKETIQKLMRLSIGKKLLLGFLSYGVITFLIALFALSSLDQVNKINHNITQRDIPLMEICEKMAENLLAQELYTGRSIILQSPEVTSLFWKRNEEFKNLILQLKNLPQPERLPVESLTALHEEYSWFLQEGFKASPSSIPKAKQLEVQAKEKQEALLQLVKKISWSAKRDQMEKNQKIAEIGHWAFRVTAGLSVVGILLGILVTMIITRNISGPIHQLKLSTREISEGRFDDLPTVQSGDELGDLSKAFKEMAGRLKKLEEMYLDANPLTRLPGGVAIEEVLKARLAEDAPLAFCLFDLRHFKGFNDRYGYARGNEVILATAEIIREAVREHGGEGDFIGHIGGDDFVLITRPGRHERIGKAVIEAFDRKIQTFYDPEDRQKGYIQGTTRKGQVVSFPIMTLSIAVVTNQQRKLKSHIQVGEIAAEMKNFAKTFSQSVCVVDKRRDNAPQDRT
ncbi:MAG: diguanylate cyclase [Syntrophaceae bacterium]|nr:diguanylate cyclase [Syntrophaceae bacterium]